MCVIAPLWKEKPSNAGGGHSSIFQLNKFVDGVEQTHITLSLPGITNHQEHGNSKDVDSTHALSMDLGVCRMPFQVLLDTLYNILQYFTQDILCNNTLVSYMLI